MSKSRAGDFRHRVRIDQPSAVQQTSTDGEVIQTFVPMNSGQLFAAAIAPEGGSEGLVSQGVLGTAFTRIRLRWAPALANLGPSHRIVRVGLAGRDDVIYNITAVVEAGFERGEIVLRCTSGANLG